MNLYEQIADAKARRQPITELPAMEFANEYTGFSVKNGSIIFAAVCGVGLLVSAAIATQVFFGVVALGGIVAIAETNRTVKTAVVKGGKVLDLVLFGASIYAMAYLGVTVAGALTITGLGLTLVVLPSMRERYYNTIPNPSKN